MDHQPKKRNERSISVNFAQEGLTTPKRQRRAKRPVRVDLVGKSESIIPRAPLVLRGQRAQEEQRSRAAAVVLVATAPANLKSGER